MTYNVFGGTLNPTLLLLPIKGSSWNNKKGAFVSLIGPIGLIWYHGILGPLPSLWNNKREHRLILFGEILSQMHHKLMFQTQKRHIHQL